MTTKDLLVGYIRAGYPAVWMQSAEEARAMRIIGAAANEIGNVPGQHPMPLVCWSFTKGWQGEIVKEGRSTKDPAEALRDVQVTSGSTLFENAVVVFKDFHPFLEDPEILRLFRDLVASIKAMESGTFVVILSPVLNLKPEIEKDVLVLDLPLPDTDELAQVLDGIITVNEKLSAQGAKLYGVPRETILDGLAGLTLLEAENVLSLTIIRHGTLDGPALKSIHREKAHVLKKNGLLRYKESDRGPEDVGGLDVLKAWFKDRMIGFTAEAREAGLQAPKGCLLVGVQGCGKSLAAEAVANLYQVPLIEGSIGDVMGSLVGESERKMREMLATADAIGRCVLRLDEFEKMAAGMESSGRTDGGTTSRVMKDFLTWLNDRKSPVFVVATVNRIDALPAEVLRKGRFDEIFFVDLPTLSERREILIIHLKRNRLEPATFDLNALAEKTAGFSGAEIEQAIVSARYRSFAAKTTLTTDGILAAIAQTKPLSVTMKSQIDAVRERLMDVAVAASSPESAAPVASKNGRKLKG